MATLRANIDLLRDIPIFGSLSDSALTNIVDSPENGIVSFKPLESIIEENALGDCMYVILSGTVDVRITAVGGREITIATLKPGEFFGEQALLPGATGKRNASVRALQSCELFRITKNDVALGVNQKPEKPESDHSVDAVQDSEQIRGLVRSVRLFRALSENDLANIHVWAELVSYEPGDMIFREAEQGDYMYVVLDGSVQVFVVDDDGHIVVLAELFKGNYFGEQALLPDGSGVRNANVRANTAALLVRVAKKYFQLIVTKDNKLMLALKAVGEAQQKEIEKAIGPPSA